MTKNLRKNTWKNPFHPFPSWFQPGRDHPSHGFRAPASLVNGSALRVRATAAGCAWYRRMEAVGCCGSDGDGVEWGLPGHIWV